MKVRRERGELHRKHEPLVGIREDGQRIGLHIKIQGMQTIC